MKHFTLMHKNDICGLLSIDEITGRFINYKDNGYGLSPYLGNANIQNMKLWWEMRAIPANRETVQNLIHSLDIVTNEDYLAKNLALSITDNYWIKPIDVDINYEDINFFNLKKYNNGLVPYHNTTSYSPNASLGGQMEKYWDLTGKNPVLVKEASKYYGQQAINELFATKIHETQDNDILFTKYNIKTINNGSILSLCNSFTDKNIEFISAYEILESEKISNDRNNYNAYIQICVKHGIDEEIIRNFMDYQTLTDFLISNTDEHLMNFGILRNSNTMELIGPAPIFDSGNSMFYKDDIQRPYTRIELLEQKVSSFYKTEEKILKNIKNKNILNLNLLFSPNEVAEFYKEYGIPEERANIIAENYANKYLLLKEFQQGKTISLYHEKEKPTQKALFEKIEDEYVFKGDV